MKTDRRDRPGSRPDPSTDRRQEQSGQRTERRARPAPAERGERRPTGPSVDRRRSGSPERSPGPPDKKTSRVVSGAARAGHDRRRQGDARASEQPVLPLRGELLYGRNGVLEALQGRRRSYRLFLAENLRPDDRLTTMRALAEAAGVPIEEVPRLLLDDATRGANHQGVALDAGEFPYLTLDELPENDGVVLVLDHLQDPQNFGTLLRAAEAAGVAGVVIPQDRAVTVTPAVVNASAGAVEHLPVARVPNLARALDELKQRGRWVVGLDRRPDSQDLFTTDLPTPVALVVGAEGSGIGLNVSRRCDLFVSLPMRGRVASLNAATAGAITLFELLRREGDNRTGTPSS